MLKIKYIQYIVTKCGITIIHSRIYIDYKISEESQCQVEQMEYEKVMTNEELSER